LRTYRKKRRAQGATNFRVVDEKYDYVDSNVFSTDKSLVFTRMAQTAAIIANRRTAMNNAIIFDVVIASYSCISIKI